jgi:hypothetical protein
MDTLCLENLWQLGLMSKIVKSQCVGCNMFTQMVRQYVNSGLNLDAKYGRRNWLMELIYARQ